MGPEDFRGAAAQYYDLAPHHPNDVPFYAGRVPSSESRVLELGCGTGRVTLPLLEHCASVHGIDHSEAMLEVLRRKSADLPESRLSLHCGDICDFAFEERFDLVIAPFRVVQNLETDAQLDSLLAGIASHLTPRGRCILNAFRPRQTRLDMIEKWATGIEHHAWSVETREGVVSCYDRRMRVRRDPLVLYPELIYRRSLGGEVVDEAVLSIAMRCFYPDDFIEWIEKGGFRVTGRWGGYAGEAYGEGPELVVGFEVDTREKRPTTLPAGAV